MNTINLIWLAGLLGLPISMWYAITAVRSYRERTLLNLKEAYDAERLAILMARDKLGSSATMEDAQAVYEKRKSQEEVQTEIKERTERVAKEEKELREKEERIAKAARYEAAQEMERTRREEFELGVIYIQNVLSTVIMPQIYEYKERIKRGMINAVFVYDVSKWEDPISRAFSSVEVQDYNAINQALKNLFGLAPDVNVYLSSQGAVTDNDGVVHELDYLGRKRAIVIMEKEKK